MIDLYKVQLIAQLVEAMHESYLKLEEAHSKKDVEMIKRAREAILDFKGKIDEVLK
ncbi:MAG: hypothetical protein ABIE22_05160 [archaeon]